jgi:23S rRNA (guanine745-N1)-methyltransferase
VQLTARPLAHTGDTAPMIEARSAFLGAGHYAMITAALRRAATALWPDGLVLDLGSGTGGHLSGVLDGLSDAVGLAVDASRAAVRVAARAHPRADAIIADAWQPLPLADASVGVALNVFAPRPGAEFARVLRPDGVLLSVAPTAEHLTELIGPLDLLRVDPAKGDRVAGQLNAHFARVEEHAIGGVMTLDHTEIGTLVGMGPSAWHTDPGTLAERIGVLPDPMEVTAAVTLSVYRPR